MMASKLGNNWRERLSWAVILLMLVVALLPVRTKLPIIQPLSTVILFPSQVIVKVRLTLSEKNAENRRLLKLANELALENARLRTLLQKFASPLSLEQDTTSFVRAEVIARDFTTLQRFLVVSWEGDEVVTTGAVALTPHGIVGRVIAVREHQALIQSVLEPSFRIAVTNSRSRELAIVHPAPNGLLLLDYAKKEADFLVGDTILTSGLGRVFPKNLKVGVVTEIRDEPGTLFKRVFAQPFVDVTRVEQLFLLPPLDPFPVIPQKLPIPEGV
ncbi:MAG: rod shape-determining protein MreC [candidate division WOR-3 bacterium]